MYSKSIKPSTHCTPNQTVNNRSIGRTLHFELYPKKEVPRTSTNPDGCPHLTIRENCLDEFGETEFKDVPDQRYARTATLRDTILATSLIGLDGMHDTHMEEHPSNNLLGRHQTCIRGNKNKYLALYNATAQHEACAPEK